MPGRAPGSCVAARAWPGRWHRPGTLRLRHGGRSARLDRRAWDLRLSPTHLPRLAPGPAAGCRPPPGGRADSSRALMSASGLLKVSAFWMAATALSPSSASRGSGGLVSSLARVMPLPRMLTFRTEYSRLFGPGRRASYHSSDSWNGRSSHAPFRPRWVSGSTRPCMVSWASCKCAESRILPPLARMLPYSAGVVVSSPARPVSRPPRKFSASARLRTANRWHLGLRS